MKPSRLGRRAVRGGRHAVRAVARRPVPVAVVGLAAATVLGLGAIAAAEPDGFDESGRHRHSHSQELGPWADPHGNAFPQGPGKGWPHHDHDN